MNGVVKRGGGGYLHPHQFTMTLEAGTGPGAAAGRELGAAGPEIHRRPEFMPM